MAIEDVAGPMIALIEDIGDVADLELDYDDGCWFYRVPLCISECGQWSVSMDVGYREEKNTSPIKNLAATDYVTLGYEIIIEDLFAGEVHQTYDPMLTREAIPKPIRQKTLDIVCECYKKLALAQDFERIFRFTKLQNPHEKALKKHLQHTETLTNIGYRVLIEGTDELNRKFWLLGKG